MPEEAFHRHGMLQHAWAVYWKYTKACDKQKNGHLRSERKSPEAQLGQHSIPDVDGEEVHEGYGHAQGRDDSSCQVQFVDDDRKDSSKDGPKNYGTDLHITSLVRGQVATFSCMLLEASLCNSRARSTPIFAAETSARRA